jgi:hypothetical protein
MNVTVKRTLASFLALAALACGGAPQASPPATTASAPAAAAPESTVPAAGAPAPPVAAAAPPITGSALGADNTFGVPECDDYFRKYYACVETKVPEATRAAIRQGIDQTRSQWVQIASTPAGRASLADACTRATVAARQAVAAWGCSW